MKRALIGAAIVAAVAAGGYALNHKTTPTATTKAPRPSQKTAVTCYVACRGDSRPTGSTCQERCESMRAVNERCAPKCWGKRDLTAECLASCR